jgi:diadenosine tetraphosphate (Ap4A) HIT family hydrolase
MIHQFPDAFLVVGEHAYFPGYCVLVLKSHVRDLHELPPPEYTRFLEELRVCSAAVATAYRPDKMNHASYGNAVPHLHWHLFPRRKSESLPATPPWSYSAEFDSAPLTPEICADTRLRISQALKIHHAPVMIPEHP